MQFLTFALTWLLAHARERGERGQDLIEYAMLGGLIALAIVAVAAIGAYETPLKDMITGIGGCIDFKPGGCAPF